MSTNDSPPPKRPADKHHFETQPSVSWFSPRVLADAGLRVALSSAFGAFLDKRELQKATPSQSYTHMPHDAQENAEHGIWFDFIADTGDGFDATYTVAWLASQEQLTLANHAGALQRPELVVMGGDEVYPVGNPAAYESRLKRPFQAALPWLPTDQTHDVYAIPGNHDWYDGLTAFFRVFCQGQWIGARKPCQSRSYFAIRLPHDWWILGIDIQLDSYIDDPQLDYFREVGLGSGHKVILCTATPNWYEGPRSQDYKNVQYFEREIITKVGARVLLSLSGDSHHYAHYTGRTDGTDKVTAGGGGAFTHPTHPLPRQLVLPMGAGRDDQVFERGVTFPDTTTSRARSLEATYRLPLANWTFMFLPAAVYVLLGWSAQFTARVYDKSQLRAGSQQLADVARRSGAYDLLLGLFRNPVSVLILVVFLAGLIGFAKPPKQWKLDPRPLVRRFAGLAVRVPLGVAHLALHVAAVVLVGLIAVDLAKWWFAGGAWFTVFLLVWMAVLGGLIGSMIVGLYLGIACAVFNLHGNDAWSSMRLTAYKNFLRIQVTADELLVYPIGITKSCTTWDFDPDNPEPSAPFLKPRHDPVAHLIEPPFTVRDTAAR